MRWRKIGQVYCPPGNEPWARHSFLTPTPFELDELTIRVYGAVRDDQGVGRIAYVDVSSADPSRIIRVGKKPILNPGRPGMFDDNGVILGDVVRVGTEVRMYYVGFQLVDKVKFLAFTGLAVSTDNGESFERAQDTPILDRNDAGAFFRAIHTVRKDKDTFQAWLGSGCNFEHINDTPYPSYNIRFIDSLDGITFSDANESVALDRIGREYRIGRPRVFKKEDKYQMLFTYGTLDGEYLSGCASSVDGRSWQRCPMQGLSPEGAGWDGKSVCYPAAIKTRDRWIVFYNGNNYGKTGFGCAIEEFE